MLERTAHGIGYIAADWPLDPEKSTMVFIHGSGGSSLFWQAQVDGLAGRANTIAVDLPGRGRSGGDGNYTVDEYAAFMASFINDIKAPHPIPCGLSLGGAVAQQLLLDYRELFPAGVLIGTGSRLKVAPQIFETINKDFSEFLDLLGKFAVSKQTDSEVIKTFRELIAQCKAEIVEGDFRACNRFDVGDQLPSIEVPVLVITAEEDVLTPPKYGDFLQKQIKNTSRAHIMDAGHIVPLEKPDEVNTAIIQFLDQCGL